MFYGKGFRSAWYLLEKGDQLNEPGDTNPFPQAFIFLSGEGRARIGGKDLTVKLNEAYLIPPDTEHIIWNDREEPLTLIFLAWGEGA
jgi:mannose-6-phosphate isomerase-like protein (cupin superfamily)